MPAEPPPDHPSGEFSFDRWWLHQWRDDPRGAQYASAHESHHLQLNSSTLYGAMIRILSALRDATAADRYARTATDLTGACRNIHEAFATWARAAAG